MGVVVSDPQRSDFLNFANYLDFLETIVTDWLSQITDVAPGNRISNIGQGDFFEVSHWVQMSLREV